MNTKDDAAQSAPDEREAFEAWLSSLKFVSGQGQAHVEYCLHRDLSDKYTTEWVSDMYRGFQAGAAWQRAQSAAGVPEERDNPENMDGIVRKYARHAAWVFGNAQGLKYTPKNAAEAEGFEPHGWVVHAIWSAFEDGKAYQAGRINQRMRGYGVTLAAPAQPAAQASPAPSADGGKVESAGALHALQVDALNHIIRTCQGSRTSTRRLRWIEQRAKYALDGKPYSDEAFDLPKDATGSNEKLRDEVRRLREGIGALLSAGNCLSNIAYNLAQQEGAPLERYTCELMRMQREQWDKAVRALSAQLEAIQAARGEVVEVVGYLLEKGNGLLSRMNAEGNDLPLMTVAQFGRIVAAMAAELEQVSGQRDDWFKRAEALGRMLDERDAELAALRGRQEAVVWLIDWPDEPELGHYFSDEQNNTTRSRPLYLAPPATQDVSGLVEDWSVFIGYLIDKYEGHEVTEENLQWWMSEMLSDHHYGALFRREKTADGKPVDHSLPLVMAIEAAEEEHGSLRAAATALGIDPAYLCRLKNGDKVNPSDDVLAALGLERVTLYRGAHRQAQQREGE